MKKFYILALVAMMFAACTTDKTQDLRPADAPETLTVGFEGGDDNTRVQLNEAGKTVWTKDDLVSVFYRSDANQKWQFQGETGDTNGKLKRISQGNTPNIGLDKVVAVYPYNEDYLIELQTGNIQAYLPNVQKYAEDSYGIGSSIMISSSRTDKLYLKNVCGWLKLQITGDAVIDHISLKGNNGEQVAGNVFITADDASCTLASDLNDLYGDGSGDLEGTLIDPNTIFTEIILDCANAVQLGAEPTAFYIALPPQTFEKGITVEIADTSGYTMTQSTDKSLAIERNTIQPMAEFKVEIEKPDTPDTPDTPTLPTPAKNEIWYTNGSTTEATTPNKTDVFGANIVSNLYDAEKECWVITFDGDVTKIGDSAFDGYDNTDCRKITSITIPDSVTSIGWYAFSDCTSLKAFYGKFASEDNRCLVIDGVLDSFAPAGITSYTIPDSVTEIKGYAFRDCTSLTSVTIGNGVTSIGYEAFGGCTSLTRVDISDLSAWCKISFDNSSSSNPLWNGAKLYINNTEATDIIIPSDITEIKNSAFWGCTSLTNITIPNSVTSIGAWAFYNCTSLTSVTIPNSVTKIRGYAFSGCSSLTSITIPDSVTEIKGYAFRDCTSLTSIAIPDSVTSIGYQVFGRCTSLTNVTIPDSVTSIGWYAFEGCSSLTSITIPDSVTEIKGHAFSRCTSLTRITIPDSVTSIGYQVFSGCTSLTNVTIGNGVTEIGEEAFSDCTSLKEVYCKPTTPPTGGSSMFSNNASDRKIYVPASDDDGIIYAYKAKQYWSNYKSYIFEYDFSTQQ